MASRTPQLPFAEALKRALATKAARLFYLTLVLALGLSAGLYWLSTLGKAPPASDAWRLERPEVRAQLAWLEAMAREGDDPQQTMRYSLIVGSALESLLVTPEGAALAADAAPLLAELQAKLARGEDVAGVVAHLDALLQPEGKGG